MEAVDYLPPCEEDESKSSLKESGVDTWPNFDRKK
jgi:hypothetical protein